VLAQHSINHAVMPTATMMGAPVQRAFMDEPQTLGQRPAAPVSGHRPKLYPLQLQILKAVAENRLAGRPHDTSALGRLIDPIAQDAISRRPGDFTQPGTANDDTINDHG
jgi:hypothetical protein